MIDAHVATLVKYYGANSRVGSVVMGYRVCYCHSDHDHDERVL